MPKYRPGKKYVHVSIVPVEIRDPAGILVERVVLNHNFRRAKKLKRAAGGQTFKRGINALKRVYRRADVRRRLEERAAR